MLYCRRTKRQRQMIPMSDPHGVRQSHETHISVKYSSQTNNRRRLMEFVCASVRYCLDCGSEWIINNRRRRNGHLLPGKRDWIHFAVSPNGTMLLSDFFAPGWEIIWLNWDSNLWQAVSVPTELSVSLIYFQATSCGAMWCWGKSVWFVILWLLVGREFKPSQDQGMLPWTSNVIHTV